jgi:hypothetical protein
MQLDLAKRAAVSAPNPAKMPARLTQLDDFDPQLAATRGPAMMAP